MNTREVAADWSGTILDGRYRILGLLGRGGMGHVYAAVHMVLDQQVAIKVLHPRLAEDPRFRARFLQEARAASRIRHPNVVDIKDFGAAPNGSVYLVMEHLRGRDLAMELRHQGALPWARARNILVQAASALQAAHAKQIIHRDIKPDNCFLLDDEDEGLCDVVKLVDFGIAKIGDASSKGLTGIGEILGTVSYMSPEQARSEPLDARSDVYSLGAMAYEMLTGLVPFRGSAAFRVIAAHLREQPEPLRSLVRQVPAAVDELVLRMLAKAPDDRYASMKAVVQALRAIPETAGRRRTQLWTPRGDMRSRAVRGEVIEPSPWPSASTPLGSTHGLPTPGPRSATDEDPTMKIRPEASRDCWQIGEPSVVSAPDALTLVGTSTHAGPSTERQQAVSDTLETKRSSRTSRRSRRLARIALVGVLGLLAGGSTVLVTNAWLSSDGARRSLEGRAEPRSERATEPGDSAAGGLGSAR
jgi:serine/threonine protein kinase